MKRFLSLLLVVFMATVAMHGANSGWYLYIWSDASSSGGDLGQFQTTSTNNVFTLENVTISEGSLKFCVRNSSWSTMYGWSQGTEGSVTSSGTDVALGSTSSASGWLDITPGDYDVTFNLTALTIRFDVHSSGGDDPATAKKVSILGDSYSTFAGYLTPSTNISWYSDQTTQYNPDNDVTTVEQTWWHKFITAAGYNLDVNNSYSGSTVSYNCYEGMDISTSFLSRMGTLGTPDIIFVFGGTNDYWSNTAMGEYKYGNWTNDDLNTFRPALAKVLSTLQTNHPAADIYFILNEELGRELENSAATICEHYGVTLIFPQGVAKGSGHPTSAGMTTIADAVTDVVINGNDLTSENWVFSGGGDGEWTTYNFTSTSYNPYIYEIANFTPTSSDLDSYGYYHFAIANADWSKQYYYNGNVGAYGTYVMTSGNTNCYGNVFEAGKTYRVIWSPLTGEFTVTLADEGNIWCLTGDFNNWSTTAHAFTQSSTNSNEFVLDNFTVNSSYIDAYGGFSFNVVTTDWTFNYTFDQTMRALDTYTLALASSGGNYATALNAGSTYRFIWNKSTHQLIIEEAGGTTPVSGNLVYVDGNLLRWNADDSEVRLFGVNYGLPSANDYRAAGYVGMSSLASKKAMIDEDLDHLVRLGFDAIRIPFYGDYENTDASGNLVSNDHLTLLDYLIKQASDRDIYIMLTPIVGYDSQWPENGYSSYTDDGGTGFARNYSGNGGKWQLMYTNETPYTYANTYLTQLLNHTNSFTGNAIKNEPNILMIEVLNEPTYGSDLLTYYSSYTTQYQSAINGYVSTIAATGCTKPVFFNVSQSSVHPSAIVNGSNANGGTYAWYPFGISHNYGIQGNGLLWTDRFTQLTDQTNYPFSKPKAVYEFDAADRLDGYSLPAMAREFRRGGVQFAALYSYDELRTAPYNNSTRTHYFNMVYTPQKAVSAMIAAEVMRQVTAGSTNSYYPSNNVFGDFTLDHNQNLAVLNDGVRYYNSNNTTIAPKNAATIEHIAGYGSSPVVDYYGSGIYFLDRTGDDTWTLEIYPDIVEISDPFKDFGYLNKITSPDVVHKSRCNTNDIYINLPSLQASFSLAPGKYTIEDGVITDSESLPAQTFYNSITGTEPSSTIASNTATTVTLVKASEDQWERVFVSGSYSHDYHNPTTTLTCASSNNYRYDFTVSSLADNTDYANYNSYPDATLQVYVGDRMTDAFTPTSFTVNAKYLNNRTTKALFLVVDNDGKAWGKEITLGNNLSDITVNVSDLEPYKAAMLPLDWPGVNTYWFPASVSNNTSYNAIDWSKVDFIQLSMRKDLYSNQLNQSRGFSLDYVKMTGTRNLTISENDEFALYYAPSYYNLTIDRSMEADEWTTICLPVWLTRAQCEYYFGSNVEVAEFTGVSDANLQWEDNQKSIRITKKMNFTTLNPSSSTYMVANKPYLIKPSVTTTSSSTAPRRDGTRVRSAITGNNWWVETFEPEGVTQGDYTFIGTKVKRDATQSTYANVNDLGNLEADPDANSNTTIGATHAYILAPTGQDSMDNGIAISVDGVVTHIDNIQIIRPADGRIYNMQGQFMGTSFESLPSGIYIQNGKKISK